MRFTQPHPPCALAAATHHLSVESRVLQLFLPRVLGILVAGLLMRNLPWSAVDAFPSEWGSQIRAAALATIYLRCGLELDFEVGAWVGVGGDDGHAVHAWWGCPRNGKLQGRPCERDWQPQLRRQGIVALKVKSILAHKLLLLLRTPTHAHHMCADVAPLQVSIRTPGIGARLV